MIPFYATSVYLRRVTTKRGVLLLCITVFEWCRVFFAGVTAGNYSYTMADDDDDDDVVGTIIH
jgi:chloramphenicol 3-O-phosphotransferase